MMDFNAMKNATEVKNAARTALFEEIMEFLKERHGEENVSIIGSNELAVVMGTRKDSFGAEREVCATLKPSVKDYEDRKTEKKFFEAFVRADAVQKYEDKEAEKAENAAIRAAAKKNKIEKDIARRKGE